MDLQRPVKMRPANYFVRYWDLVVGLYRSVQRKAGDDSRVVPDTALPHGRVIPEYGGFGGCLDTNRVFVSVADDNE